MRRKIYPEKLTSYPPTGDLPKGDKLSPYGGSPEGRQANGGYIAITTSIILSLLILAISITLGSASLFSRNNNLNFSYKKTSYSMARTCLDYALLQLALNSNYAGKEIKIVDSYNCAVVSVLADGSNKIIRASSTVRGAFTNLKLTVDSARLSTVALEEVVKF